MTSRASEDAQSPAPESGIGAEEAGPSRGDTALRERLAEVERDLRRERVMHRMATQHALDADAREAEADAKAARAEARYQTEYAAHRREVAERFQVEQQRDSLLADLKEAERTLADLCQLCRVATIPPLNERVADFARRILSRIEQKETPCP